MYMPLDGHPEKRKLQDYPERGHTEAHSFLRSIKLENWSIGLRRALLSLCTFHGLSVPLKSRFAS